MVRMLVGIALVIALLAFNLWVFSWIRGYFEKEPAALLIAPVQFVGRDGVTAEFGTALAEMVRARLIEVNRQLQVFERLPRVVVAASDLTAARPSTQFVHVPNMFEAVDISAKVGDVDVGGVLSWIARRVSADNLLRITVHEFEENDKRRLTVASSASGDASSGLWFRIESASDSELVDQIAYALAFEVMQGRMTELEAFNRAEFADLLTALDTLDGLNQQVQKGRPSQPRDYKSVLDKLAPLQQLAPKWMGLTEVLAQVAQSAQEVPQARSYFQQLFDATSDAARKAELQARLDSLQAVAQVTQPVPVTARAGAATSSAVFRSPITRLIRLVEPTPSAAAILVYGPDPDAEDAAKELREYSDTIGQAIRHIAPKVEVQFSGDTPNVATELPQTLNKLLSRADELPRVILLPYRVTGAERAARKSLEALVEKGHVVVIPAGNEAGTAPYTGTNAIPGVAIVGAVDLNGEPTAYTSRGEGTLWAPGSGIPMILDGRPQTRDGTGYASAIAAAAAAMLVAQYEKLSPAQIVERLRSTSRAASGTRAGTSVLDVAALLKRPAPPEAGRSEPGASPHDT